MKKLIPIIAASGLLLFSSGTAFAGKYELNEHQEKIKKIMEMPHRTDADKKRDENRNPIWAINFMGMTPDMKVIEFGPGDGWYSKILAPYLKEKGELHIATKGDWFNYSLNDLLKKKPMNKAKKLPIEIDWNPEIRAYELGDLDFGMNDADMVLSIREYHVFNAEGKEKFNREAFESLKPGGKYIVIDHTRRHMQPETKELGRREDPVDVILEVQGAGFKLESSSDMFFRPDDELIYEVGRKTVTGNTDRFFFVFTKPKA